MRMPMTLSRTATGWNYTARRRHGWMSASEITLGRALAQIARYLLRQPAKRYPPPFGPDANEPWIVGLACPLRTDWCYALRWYWQPQPSTDEDEQDGHLPCYEHRVMAPVAWTSAGYVEWGECDVTREHGHGWPERTVPLGDGFWPLVRFFLARSAP